MKLLLLTVIIAFHSLLQANEINASIITKKDNQLVMVSEFVQAWTSDQVPFNTLKNLPIKGTFLTEQKAILVVDINETVTPVDTLTVTETHVMTAQEKLVPADILTELNAVKVQVTSEGNLSTVTANPEKATLVGKLIPMNQQAVGLALFLNASGQVITETGAVVGHALNEEGAVVSLVTDLDSKIATLTGSGSEVVITGEKKEFLSSINELETLNAQQKQNPEWVPVTDLKISSLASMVQVEFRNSTEDESFSLFKLVSPLVVNQIKENKAQN